MARKIVLAFDSFKGSLSSMEAAEAAREAIAAIYPECIVETVTIADGGEGTAGVIAGCIGEEASRIDCRVANPLSQPVEASYFIAGDTAIIEMAAASGLTLIASHERNPMLTTTLGTGQLIADALDRGCRNFLLGIGGSATNDAAMGALSALGFRFIDAGGSVLEPIGKNLAEVASIDRSHIDARLEKCRFTVACDVNSPFFGKDGAAHVFAPQKGADPTCVEMLDFGLRNFANVLLRTTGIDIATVRGAGAAGGMGGTMMALLGASLRQGIEIVLDLVHFDSKIADADLIITGEGAIDSQSGMGKVLTGIVGRARRLNIPVVALAGSVSDVRRLNECGLRAVFCIQSRPISLAEAMLPHTARHGIAETTSQILRLLDY